MKRVNTLPLEHASKLLIAHGGSMVTTEKKTEGHFSGVKIDSRQIGHGDIFVALKGEKVDGHDFISEAINQGVVAVIIDNDMIHNLQGSDIPIIKVSCTRQALGQLARLWRTTLFAGKIIALTGSNGKTTIKNMLHHVLSQRYKVGSTQDNYNNEIGLPLTIFDLPLDCDYWVLEMGAKHVGDINYLCHIACPEITFISNIGHAHIGEFGGRDKQLQAKAEILSYGNVSLLDGDSPFYQHFYSVCKKKHLSNTLVIRRKKSLHGSGHSCGFYVTWDFDEGESIFDVNNHHLRLKLNCLGEHNAHNAAWAVAVADYCGVEHAKIRDGLLAVYPQPGRLQTIQGDHFTILDDSYNASPESVEALLKLKHPDDRVIVVWGDMLELGNEVQMHQWHRDMAHRFAAYHIDWVITYGEYAHSTYLHGKTLPTGRQSEGPKYHHAENFLHIKKSIQTIMATWQAKTEEKKNNHYVYLKASNKMNFSKLAKLLTSNQLT